MAFSFLVAKFFLLPCILSAIAGAVLLTEPAALNNAVPTFTIDRSPSCNCFRKNGQPYRYISGNMHYFQVPYEYWPDRMAKMRAAGLNALSTYISWNLHEPFKGVYNFEEQNNIFNYFNLGKNNSLDVILRIGPFINAERDNGGLPFWLLNVNSNMRPRTSDPTYQAEVKAWYDVLLPKIKPYLYINGGNIITVQIENEYGCYSICDKAHLKWLHDLTVSHLGAEVVYFTTDNGNVVDWMKCGQVDGAQVTSDFGVYDEPNKMFSNLRQVEPSGPVINSEFYPGWIVHWNDNYTRIADDIVVNRLDEILQYENFSCVNIYPIHGGTNFGFNAGATYDGNPKTYEGFITSYDFNAPITENGDTTTKYMKIRSLIQQKYNTLPLPDIPANVSRTEYPTVFLQKSGDLFSNLSIFTTFEPMMTPGEPQTYEEVLLDYGFALYEHLLTDNDLKSNKSVSATLHASGIHDRAVVLVDGVRKGFLCRICQHFDVDLGTLQPGQTLSIFCENQGRVAFGADTDAKGLNVGEKLTLTAGSSPVVLMNWQMTPIPVNETALWSVPTGEEQINGSITADTFVPTRYQGSFLAESTTKGIDGHLADTFLRLSNGWKKGIVLVNGHNLGRYWPEHSSQVTLYVPGVWLHVPPQSNYLTVLEMDYSPCECAPRNRACLCEVQLVAEPYLDKPLAKNTA